MLYIKITYFPVNYNSYLKTSNYRGLLFLINDFNDLGGDHCNLYRINTCQLFH